MSRRRAVMARWVDILMMSSLAAGVCFLVNEWTGFIQSMGSAAHSRGGALLAGAFLVAVPLALLAGRGRWLAFLGLRHFFSYPPIWVAGVFGAAIAIGSHALVNDRGLFTDVPDGAFAFVSANLSRIIILLLLIAVAAPLLILLVVKKIGRADAGREEARDDQSTKGPDQEFDLATTVEWYRTDKEVEHPRDDRFGHDAVARRIAERLADASLTGEAPTIAVVGPLGSGKTTIAGLVQHHLAKSPSVQLVHLSLWPYDSPDAAVRGILAALVDALSNHVNKLGLSRLPQQYVTTVEGVGGRWGALARLLAAPPQPADVLRRVELVTRAINVRQVLWIDDLERFAGVHGVSDSADLAASERLAPVRALLWLLDRCEQVSIIVADCTLDTRFDLDKIARFVERIPPMHPDRVRSEFRGYRDQAVREAGQLIDPVDDETREGFLSSSRSLMSAYFRDDPDHMELDKALALTLGTPRALKMALRASHDVWRQQAGEIDLDDVLVMSALRAARPTLFSLIDGHIDAFRNGFRWRKGTEDQDPKQHPLFAEFEKVLEAERTDRDREAVATLVRAVFRLMPVDRVIHDPVHIREACPQSLAVEGHIDYWNRYLSAAAVPEEESDQPALRSIRSWQETHESDLVERIIDDKRSAQIEHFVGQFDREELPRLLQDVAEYLRHVPARHRDDWPDWPDDRGIAPVWRMMLRRPPNRARLQDVLLSLVRDIVGDNLPLVYLLTYYVGSPGAHTYASLLTEEQRVDLRNTVETALVREFHPGRGAELLRALQEGSPYTLVWVCWRQQVDRSGLPFDGWQDFATTMLEAAESDRERGLAQLVPFVTTLEDRMVEVQGRSLPSRVAVFDRNAAARLFDFQRLERLLAETEVPAGLQPDLSERWRAARSACRSKA